MQTLEKKLHKSGIDLRRSYTPNVPACYAVDLQMHMNNMHKHVVNACFLAMDGQGVSVGLSPMYKIG